MDRGEESRVGRKRSSNNMGKIGRLPLRSRQGKGGQGHLPVERGDKSGVRKGVSGKKRKGEEPKRKATLLSQMTTGGEGRGVNWKEKRARFKGWAIR